MAYRGGHYDFVIDSSFQPFTMQEMLAPLALYKEAFEKSEEAYTDLKTKADVFKDLSRNLPENSEARKIYEGYANDLSAQADDLARNGLNMGNRRALTSLKQRYSGEIGALERAKTKRDEVLKTRDALMAAGKPMLFATDTNDLSIDNFLFDRTPNMYGVNTDDLYVRGAAAGKAASSRVFSVGDAGSTLGGYFRDWVSKNGYSAESINAFRKNIASIPELQMAADSILREKGVSDNLSGNSFTRAQEAVINGIIDGAIYTESHSPQRDLNVLTPQEKFSQEMALREDRRAVEKQGWERQNQRMKVEDWKTNRALTYEFKDGKVVGYKDLPVGYERNPITGKVEKSSSHMTPEEKAIAEVQKEEIKKQMKDSAKMKSVKTIEAAAKLGYVPIMATVHVGTTKGKSLDDARSTNDFSIVNGWRSGVKGHDVPGIYIDHTSAPLVKGSQSWWPDLIQWRSGGYNSPNNGDFDYDLSGMDTKMLSDEEFNALPDDVKASIQSQMVQQGYDIENLPSFEVMEVAGRYKRGGRKSYLTFVKDSDIITGNK